MSTIIIFAGMARSGTSLIAHLLQEAGMHLGQRMAEPSLLNPHGFFEDRDFSEFHNRALATRGYKGFVPKDFVFTPTPEETTQARALIAQRMRQPLWGWKDPQTTLFLDFWHRLLPEAFFLFTYRHPLDMMMSMIRYKGYDGLPTILDSWYANAWKIKEFRAQHPTLSLICYAYSVIDHVETFDSLLQKKFKSNLSIKASVLRELYDAESLVRAPITSEIHEVLCAIHPESARLFEELNARADLPDPWPPPPCPIHTQENSDLAAFKTLAFQLNLSGNRSRIHGLLQLLASFLKIQGEKDNFDGQYSKYYTDLQKNNIWLTEQYNNWKQLAEEQQRWMKELEQGKVWLEQQCRNWQQFAEEREKWIHELERGKHWLEREYKILKKAEEKRLFSLKKASALMNRIRKLIGRK